MLSKLVILWGEEITTKSNQTVRFHSLSVRSAREHMLVAIYYELLGMLSKGLMCRFLERSDGSDTRC